MEKPASHNKHPVMWIRIAVLIIYCLGLSQSTAQPLYPVKVDKRWGLMDAAGKLSVLPSYDAIGEFKQFGYAVMQRQGRVGLLGASGKEVIPARYEDIKVLDASLVAVMEQGEWMVINMRGQRVLDKGYKRVQVLRAGYLAYLQDTGWGIVDHQGNTIAPPEYDEVDAERGNYFITRSNDRLGLLTTRGQEILANRASEIRILNDSIIFYREDNLWGAIDGQGKEHFAPSYEMYRPINRHFYKLFAKGRFYVYSLACGSMLSAESFDDYYPYSARYLMVKEDRRLGLIDWCGQVVLPPRYNEIQTFGDDLFRVNVDGKWGIVARNDEQKLRPVYDYISPLRGPVCLVKAAGSYGLVNLAGELIAPAEYERIELEDNLARAYPKADNGTAMTVYRFDQRGQLQSNGDFNQHFTVRISGQTEVAAPGASNYQLEKFEWFYSPEADRWGLRRLADGAVQIEPKFVSVQVEKDLGITLVGIEQSIKTDFERTTFRFDMLYGLVLNDLGMLVTELDFLDIRLADWRAGRPLARCVSSDGRHGLLERNGKINRRDLTYIGEFRSGMARVSFVGHLSGSLKSDHGLGRVSSYVEGMLAPSIMTDYTKYDQLFRTDAALTCEDCHWGYLDSTGQVIVKPAYSFVQDYVNGVGMVSCEGKWGMVDRTGKELIPCRFDGLEFLENTDNRLVRLYVQEPKYGLIDTLGQLRVEAIYDEIGSFAEGRLAVRRGSRWGFVDAEGREVIQCEYDAVQDFSGGLAAVKLGRYWGFINQQGKLDIGLQYRRVGNFRDGRAWAYNDHGTGYINLANEFVIEPKFDRAYDFFRGVARVVIDGEFGLVDTSGRYILRPRYNDISEYNSYGLAIAAYGDRQVRYGVVNLLGNMITADAYREIAPYHEGLAAVKAWNSSSYGYIDIQGKLVIPCRYARAGDFSEGRATVQLNNRCGYIDPQGAEVVPCSYSRCQDFSEGRAVVYRGLRNAGLIDRTGQHIVEPSLDRLIEFQEGRGLMRDDQDRFYYITEKVGLYDGYYEQANAFKHGVAVVRLAGKWGIINHKGIEIIPPKYDSIEGFSNGYAKVKIEGFNGLSTLDGELLAQPHYEFISYAGGGLFRVEQGDEVGYLDGAGRWIWKLRG